MGSTVDYFCIFMLWMSSTISVGAVKMGAVGLGDLPWSHNSRARELIAESNYMAPNGQPHSAPSPRLSPKSSPRSSPSQHAHAHPRPHPHKHLPAHKHHKADPNVSTHKLNDGQKIGLALACFAGLLQVVVVTYLLVKRKQMLRVVEKYDV